MLSLTLWVRLISTAKGDLVNYKIVKQTGKKSLFKIVDSFLHKKLYLRLSHDDLLSLLENFFLRQLLSF